MEIRRATLADAPAAEGAVVVIDVIRAFTTAAYAFAGGARDIRPVRTVEEAFAVREREPDVLLAGEVDGIRIEGFDFDNSPAEVQEANLDGRRLVHRTSHGTQGLTLATRATHLFAGSFAVAGATVAALQTLNPAIVTLLVTCPQDEDRACADYLEARLRGGAPDPAPFLARVRASGDARPRRSSARAPAAGRRAADLDACATLDSYGAALSVRREGGGLRIPAPVAG